MATKALLVLTTGGTIGGHSAHSLAGSISRDSTSLEAGLAPSAAALAERWGIELRVDVSEILALDSSDMTHRHWANLAETIRCHYDTYDGFIVTHGTNTMGYTCAALSFALGQLNKPVVVTGSQLPYGYVGSDALANLERAVLTATYPYGAGIRGVVCVFASHIIAGTRVTKSDGIGFEAFTPAGYGALGRFGSVFNVDDEALRRHHRYSNGPALRASELDVKSAFDPRVLSVTEFPGLPPEILSTVLPARDRSAIRGVVLRASGAGDVSTHLHPVLEQIKEAGVPVVVAMQTSRGSSNFGLNEPGRALQKRGLAIPAYDMSIEAVTTKLMWLLAQDLSYDELGIAMRTDFRGEIAG